MAPILRKKHITVPYPNIMEDFVFSPTDLYLRHTKIHMLKNKLGFNNLEELYIFADSEPENFWRSVVDDCKIDFFEKFEKVQDSSKGIPYTKWFVNGKINVDYNCVYKNRNSTKPAVKWEEESGKHGNLSYHELDGMVGRLAGSLVDLGVKKGDRVAIFMPLCKEAIIAFYSIVRIGAVVVPIFSGYGEEAVRKRVEDAGITFMFTSEKYMRKGKEIRMRDSIQKIHGIKTIISGTGETRKGDYSFKDLVRNGKYTVDTVTDSEDPFIMLYTSGTTGKPKGTVHVHGGSFINIVKEVRYYMDVDAEDTVFWITDLGWMMGPWYIVGTHALGGSVFVYDGAVDYPSKDRIPDMITRHSISILGLSPTYVRMLRHAGFSRRFDGVRLFGSTGEPWDEEGWMYLFRELGGSEIPISNISGGTDLIGCFLASNPGIPLKPRCLYRGLGMNASVFDDSGNEVYDRVGYLVAKKPSPSLTRGLWGQEEKYIETYWSRFKDVWFHGDWALMTRDGYFYLYGRADDVIKVAGKRVGPNEVEDAVLRAHGARESACIGIPDDLKGETLVIFYMGENTETTRKNILESIQNSLGKSFAPKSVFWISNLPRTRSGKIMRRLVRAAFLGQDLGDTSNLENPEVLVEIAQLGGNKNV